MTTKIFELTHRVVLASFLAAVSLASNAEFPQGEFACHVLTEGERSGLVLVQADTESDAVRVAGAAATALVMEGGQGRAMSVVECITVPGEKFKDPWFNSFYEGLPL